MSWGYLRGVTHLDLGRQYESLPYVGMLFFAAVFGAHVHIVSLPIGVLAGVALLLLETANIALAAWTCTSSFSSPSQVMRCWTPPPLAMAF